MEYFVFRYRPSHGKLSLFLVAFWQRIDESSPASPEALEAVSVPPTLTEQVRYYFGNDPREVSCRTMTMSGSCLAILKLGKIHESVCFDPLDASQ